MKNPAAIVRAGVLVRQHLLSECHLGILQSEAEEIATICARAFFDNEEPPADPPPPPAPGGCAK